jgi:hypothetical protein
MRELIARMCRLHSECMFRILEKECPGIFARVGLDTKDETWGRFPFIPRDEIPLDWIALGFQGHDFWENHVGIPFVIEGDKATFRTGWHINSSYYLKKLSGNPIESFRFNGMRLELKGQPIGEQHFQLLPVPVTYETAGTAFQIFLDQGLALYRHIYRILKNVEPSYVPCR